jgi:hypothetical protein
VRPPASLPAATLRELGYRWEAHQKTWNRNWRGGEGCELPRIDLPRQYLGRALPIWITEYGFPTCDPAAHPEHYNCVAPREQAAFHARGMIIGFGNGVRLWSVYEFADEGSDWSDPEQNFGLTGTAANGYVPKPVFYTLQRMAEILGTDWNYLAKPPAALSVSESGSGVFTPVSGATTVTGPQMAWFSTARGYAGFVWKAGPYDDATVEARVIAEGGMPSAPLATDIVTGERLNVAVTRDHGSMTIDNLRLGSRPIVLQMIRDSAPRP